MNTTISRKVEWDMGHRIPNHQSLCRNPHGHRYVAEVVVKGPIIEISGSPEQGMVKDFGFLKAMLDFIHKQLDHGFMVFKEDPFNAALALFDKHQMQENFQGEAKPLNIIEVDFIPTAENIAAFIFKRLESRASSSYLDIVEVTVWETPNCKATVTR